MAQTTSAAAQLHIRELLRKTQEEEEEKRKRRWEMQDDKDVEQRCGMRQDQTSVYTTEDETTDPDKTAQAASSSQSSGELEIGHESEPMTASHLTKEPESSEKTIEASRSANTAQQGEDTSQKTVTAQSRSGWTITLE